MSIYAMNVMVDCALAYSQSSHFSSEPASKLKHPYIWQIFVAENTFHHMFFEIKCFIYPLPDLENKT